MKAILALSFLGLVVSAAVHAEGSNLRDEWAQYDRLTAPQGEGRGETRGSGACGPGLESFRQTVHPFVRQNCVKCHSADPSSKYQGPPFAVVDAAQGYGDLLKRVNFADIPSSRLVVKGGNHHCLDPYEFECGINSPNQVIPVVRAWWDQGQQTCPDSGKFFSPAIAIPADLPPRGDRFARMRFKLDTIGTSFAGAELQFEIQKFADPTSDRPGAYRIRRPRLVSPRRHLRVAAIRVLINGIWDPLADRYVTVDRIVGKQAMSAGGLDGEQFPTLAADSLIILQDKNQGDTISVSFEALEAMFDPPTCAAMPAFKSQVLPVLQARACLHCHGSSGVDPRAKAVLDLGGSAEAVCASALERSDLNLPTASPWVAYPFRGLFGHPRVIPSASEVFPAWSEWMKLEKAAR